MYDITDMLNRKGIMEDPEFPRLVSYPRTGSHWLRMMLELYFGMPSYVQSFFIKNPERCWGFHIHNRLINDPHWSEGKVSGLKNVIYLHRDPCDTIFSQMKYDDNIPYGWGGQFVSGMDENVERLVVEYKQHLERWLFNNDDIQNFMSLSYEQLKDNPVDSLIDISRFLKIESPHHLAVDAVGKCSKSLTKAVTPHDPKALNPEQINSSTVYGGSRESFRQVYGDKIQSRFSTVQKKLGVI